VLKGLALDADMVCVSRSPLMRLASYSEEGVCKREREREREREMILEDEFQRAIMLCGCDKL
jgi:isopentenyl diphosphate isomerase/L-lactate dehydrogenase-like FMN-dependent dehydrogenase